MTSDPIGDHLMSHPTQAQLFRRMTAAGFLVVALTGCNATPWVIPTDAPTPVSATNEATRHIDPVPVVQATPQVVQATPQIVVSLPEPEAPAGATIVTGDGTQLTVIEVDGQKGYLGPAPMLPTPELEPATATAK